METGDIVTIVLIILVSMYSLINFLIDMAKNDNRTGEWWVLMVPKLMLVSFILIGTVNLALNNLNGVKALDNEDTTNLALAGCYEQAVYQNAKYLDCKESYEALKLQYGSMYKNREWRENDTITQYLTTIATYKEAFTNLHYENAMHQIEIKKLKRQLNEGVNN